MICAAGIELFKMLGESDELHDRQQENVAYFRDKMIAAGFDIKPTQSAICAVMLYDAPLSQRFAAAMAKEGIFVTGFYYPVVPKGQARIRVQLSAAHTRAQLDKAIAVSVSGAPEVMDAFVDEELDPIDLSYFFGPQADSVRIDPVLYPDRADIERSTQEHDWGERTPQLVEMWGRVKGESANAMTGIVIGVVLLAALGFALYKRFGSKRRGGKKRRR